MHTQMYMLEGASRWNMNRAKEAVAVVGASTLRTFDVRLISHLNNMSQRVLGCSLIPEHTPPGKPTGKIVVKSVPSNSVYSLPLLFMFLCSCLFLYSLLKIFIGERIAVEYLLAQSNRGDLLIPQHSDEVALEQPEEDEGPADTTVCLAADLEPTDFPHVDAQMPSQYADSGPMSLEAEEVEEAEEAEDEDEVQIISIPSMCEVFISL